MVKRQIFPDGADGRFAPAKRPRTSNASLTNAEDITSALQLKHLLTFQQGADAQLRRSIQCFKTFLESIARGADDSSRRNRLFILKEYLDSQKGRDDGDSDSHFLTDLIQIWNYAGQVNADALLSAVPAVLALLLKTISSLLDFRDYGILLGKTILQQSQLKLVSRQLTAPKSKEFIISPCIRLLLEVVSFDGGSLAKQLYGRKDFTLENKALARNLGLRRAASADASEERRKPSVRSNAIRYLLANLKYQQHAAKIDILGQVNLFKVLFDDIRGDPPEIIIDILNVFKAHVLTDKEIPKTSKGKVFTERTLGRIATLYGYEDDQKDSEIKRQKTIDVYAHEFLLLVCSNSEHGVLHTPAGWYPPGALRHSGQQEVDSNAPKAVDLGIESLEWFSKYRDKVPVRNSALAAFAQTLRPYASALQSDLLLTLFRAAPELVADYFYKKNGFSFDPKLTATWIGYSAFLFSTVQLPLSSEKMLGKDTRHTIPPPTPIVIENILPQPLDQKTLTRCLNQSSPLITFFAIRLLTIAFEKLESTLSLFKSQTESGHNIWTEASRQLVTEFCRRCPKMKDVIRVFRSTSGEDMLQRESVSRLLAMYYRVIPQVALEEKFDISVALTDALSRLETSNDIGSEDGIGLLELEHLLQIAQRSLDIKWFHKPDSLKYSPFTSLLKLLVDAPEEKPLNDLKAVFSSVVAENEILQRQTIVPSIEVLIASLREAREGVISEDFMKFIDNCVLRLVRRPTTYLDQVEDLAAQTEVSSPRASNEPLSLFLVTIREQWSFFAKSNSAEKEAVTNWLANYLTKSREIGESGALLSAIKASLLNDLEEDNLRSIMKHAVTDGGATNLMVNRMDRHAESSSSIQESAPKEESSVKDYVASLLQGPPAENQDHPELNHWIQKDVQDVMEDGDASRLIMCLCSGHLHVRKQALISLRKLMVKLEASNYSEGQQCYLLIGEVCETASPIIDNAPLPYFVGSLAARSATVITDPLHPLYAKVNRFLNKGPSWNVQRVPSYWIENILFHPPEEADSHYREIEWLLDILIDGLRTPQEMDTYRLRNVFERFLSLYASPFLPKTIKEKIMHLIFRATFVQGSTTLITRTGVINWVQTRLAVGDANRTVLLKLAERLYDTCDKARVDDWSGGTMQGTIKDILA
ncbi:hypothetical protein L228DRAFT_246044 [Xylona heveae TC161]|uniref:Ribosome biogenesis protein Urb1 n=1 Tax=Xylona heveae (strain CBS 132557 / TC161) TaxID=1328760 RepID=A0A165HCC0_XYLHT|nr:hypothetical protein L228DRAFT_246044 [Xylona heveae TC161]KZF23290.1 hypothetical protein L228DRAFT_246044 [Xylona heveae TC161]